MKLRYLAMLLLVEMLFLLPYGVTSCRGLGLSFVLTHSEEHAALKLHLHII